MIVHLHGYSQWLLSADHKMRNRRYREMIDRLKALNSKCEFEPFSTTIPPLESFSSGFVPFESIKEASDRLLAALQDSNCSTIGLYGKRGSGKTKLVKTVDTHDLLCDKNSNLIDIEDAQDLFCDKDSNLIDIDSAGLKNDVEDVIFNNSRVETVNQVNEGIVVVNDEVKKIPIRRNCDDPTKGYEGPAISVTVGKYGAITSLSHIWMQQCESNEIGFDKILSCPEACEALSKGFSVKKLQRKQLNNEENVEEYEEFELENLIVLDGTWAKAKRIYSENPWLNILPHLKLEVNEMSLYGEVRNQPKAGYLSTIESVVFALKAVGENHEGLDNILDTFECMVDDQRRCKDERLNKLLPN
ncbi:unnamed protein product [Trifolium pratense]|uniref:Uncharacterized protein n=1 Tax=Trifolium pratense TaxID=57577 RepID=A0ACB0IQT0_TRIPR|nr:unnamed protein product [Trifolium pratense]